MNGVMIKLRERVVAAHNDEGGAIVILALAGVLIVFMTFLVMYDAGESAREKAEVQIGADMAALSHATVKARSMNMIAYANVTKRVFYGYSTIYTAAYLALVEATAYYMFMAVKFAKDAANIAKIPLVGWIGAIPWAIAAVSHLVVGLKGVLQVIQETSEGLFGSNFDQLYGFGNGPNAAQHGRSIKEVAALDTYQKYMAGLSPWWGWGEGVTRGIRNGATLVGTWPAPAGSFTRVRNKVNFAFSAMSAAGLGSIGAPWTTDEDGLPIEKPPEIIGLGPVFGSVAPKFMGHINACFGMLTSPEFWGVQYYWDHWRKSEGYWDDTDRPRRPWPVPGRSPRPRDLVTGLELLQLPVGCVMASASMGDAAIPYEIKVSESTTPGAAAAPDGWWKATSNIAIGYKKGQGRLTEGSGRRKKYGFMQQEYGLSANGMAFKNEGYWSIARAEIVYGPNLAGSLANDLLGNANSVSGEDADVGSLTARFLNVLNEPSTWEPRWTSKMRPVNMPGEELADMSSIVFDSLPYMVLGAPLALAYNDGGSFDSFSTPSVSSLTGAAQGFIEDAFFLWRAGKGFSQSRMGGGALDK